MKLEFSADAPRAINDLNVRIANAGVSRTNMETVQAKQGIKITKPT